MSLRWCCQSADVQERQLTKNRACFLPCTSSDLVWSYSRSQAFYSNNFNTSPSFVAETRWRGPHADLDEEDDEQVGEDDDEEYLEEYLDSDGEQEAQRVNPSEHDVRTGEDDLMFSAPPWSDDSQYLTSRRPSGADRAPKSFERRTSDSAKLTPTANEATPLLLQNKRNSRSSVSRRRKSSNATIRPALQHPTGRSTFGQTLFNCVNALVGVGILSLPLALSYAGLPLGIALFVLAGLITNYTGKLLHKIMMHSDPRVGLTTYADIGQYAFGQKAKGAVTLLFVAELWAVSVALIVLFGDSVYALVHAKVNAYDATATIAAAAMPSLTQWPHWAFKLIGFLVVTPTCFVPLRFLSPISIVGIFTTLSLLVIVFVDGYTKESAPGSLHQPSPDALEFRPQWNKLPLAFGLIMSGFSSHPIIPSLVRDMRNPEQFPRMLNLAYLIATSLYLTMGVAGYLMFGRKVSDEITRDLAGVAEYPAILTRVAIGFIAMVSVSKFALALRPVQSTIEGLFFGRSDATIEQEVAVQDETLERPSERQGRSTARFLLHLAIPAAVLLTALALPQFADLMSFLGSVLAGLSCICGPVAAHLVVFGRQNKASVAFRRRPSQQYREDVSENAGSDARAKTMAGQHLQVATTGPELESAAHGTGSGLSTTPPSKALSVPRRMAEWGLVGIALVMAVLGTIWGFLPVAQSQATSL